MLVGALRETLDQPRVHLCDESVGPTGRGKPQVKINEMYLDLAPTAEWKCSDEHFAAGDRLDRHRPTVIGKRVEQIVETQRRRVCVSDELLGRKASSCLDVIRASCDSTGVLLDVLTTERPIYSSTHRIGILGQVGKDMSDRPARQERWSRNVRQPENRLVQLLVREAACVDLFCRTAHIQRYRPPEADHRILRTNDGMVEINHSVARINQILCEINQKVLAPQPLRQCLQQR